MSRRTHHKGPVTLRGDQVPRTTTDQRLLDRRGPTDWVHSDPWRVMRIQAEFVEGFGALAELGPAVSVFGSARIPEGQPVRVVKARYLAGQPDLLFRRNSQTGAVECKTNRSAIQLNDALHTHN